MHELHGGGIQRWQRHASELCACVFVCFCGNNLTLYRHELHGGGIQRCACGRGMRVSHVLVCLYVLAGTVEFFVYT